MFGKQLTVDVHRTVPGTNKVELARLYTRNGKVSANDAKQGWVANNSIPVINVPASTPNTNLNTPNAQPLTPRRPNINNKSNMPPRKTPCNGVGCSVMGGRRKTRRTKTRRTKTRRNRH
jgi:hypothetical protein